MENNVDDSNSSVTFSGNSPITVCPSGFRPNLASHLARSPSNHSYGYAFSNDRFKYIVGQNGGMQLNEDGGIEIYLAAEKPAGVPEDNWLPINREDIDLDLIMRIYPRVGELKTWKAPKAEKQ